ncbi:MAG: CDP-diacylglycerol--serine O-phosphatidyltransferase [Deltaproteobacteria bacterium]|nr:CDP-diacylglycerol--serine O-phosphatidyltransferase [Deltaproteobacteria bacterium]
MIRQFLNPPNWFSSASLFCGLYAIFLAGQANGDPNAFYQAGLFIFYAGLFDALDGRVARLFGTGSAFGVQLDSLIDIISFGVAPATLAYFWRLHELGGIGVFSAFFFMLCGAFRLARFNIMSDGKVHSFAPGSTITMSGGTLAAIVMWQAGGGDGFEMSTVLLAEIALAMSLLMVSNVPYRTLKTMRKNVRTFAGITVFAGAFVYVGVMMDISTVLVAMGSIYVLSGPVELVLGYRMRRRRKLGEAAQEEK